jgi:hypothetical protein
MDTALPLRICTHPIPGAATVVEPPRNLLDLAEELGTRPCPLNSTDLELVRRLGEGAKCAAIAEDWEATSSAVYSRLACIRELLGVFDRAQIVLVCIFAHWLEITDVPAPETEGA